MKILWMDGFEEVKIDGGERWVSGHGRRKRG